MKKVLAIAGLALWMVGSGWYYTCRIKQQCYSGSPPGKADVSLNITKQEEQKEPGSQGNTAADSLTEAKPAVPPAQVVYFPRNSSRKTADQAIDLYLDKLAEALKPGNLTVLITGHADNIGSEKSNQRMGLLRAESIKALLLAKGVPESVITTVSKGKTEPVASNDNEEGRAKNRRVVIVVK